MRKLPVYRAEQHIIKEPDAKTQSRTGGCIMVGIYLSGTGNTKHCIEKLIHLLDETAQAIPIEKEEAVEGVSQHDFVVLAYPIQFSNAPVMVRDFVKRHSDLWKGKRVLCIATMGLFSGDGAGCSARLLKKVWCKGCWRLTYSDA